MSLLPAAKFDAELGGLDEDGEAGWDGEETEGEEEGEGEGGEEPMAPVRPRPRQMKDPIHDYITIDDELVMAVMDSPQMQRLRYVKQLGTSYWVWVGAAHNRFEHCVGVAHLASLLISRLRSSQPDLNITNRDVRCVQLAGLCHDLGHGPFSHMWDNLFMPTITRQPWAHEDVSERMLDFLIEDNNIDLPAKDIEFVKALIAGDPARCPEEKAFLFQIVANKINGIDVDKFDYIKRDSYCLGVQCPLDVQRLIMNCRVIGTEICYNAKEVYSVYELFLSRYSLHKRIYNHKTATAIQYMLVDAFIAADPVMQLVDKTKDPRKFLYLTDSVLEEIERSEDPGLAKSREIIRRLRTRHLYKQVDFRILTTPQAALWAGSKLFTPKGIVAHAQKAGIPGAEALMEEDVIVDWTRIHFGMKERDPIQLVKFYSSQKPDRAVKADKKWISFVTAERFQEVLFRVFTRDPSKFGLVQKAYRATVKLLPRDAAVTPPATSAPSTQAPSSKPDLPTPESASPDPSQSSSFQPSAPAQTTTTTTPSRKRKRPPTTPKPAPPPLEEEEWDGETNPFTTVACEYGVKSPMESPVRRKTAAAEAGEGKRRKVGGRS